ncbi:MAG: hypothetical protein JWP89_3127 [Schlesneria sp.]|nr:hypothetical protein [Schlesneria sp.]
MAVFGVFIKESTQDQSQLDIYTSKAGPSLAGHTVKVLAAYGPHVTFEGPEIEGAVIIEFPTMQEAKAWYNSPAYSDAREHRFRGATYRAFFVEGV